MHKNTLPTGPKPRRGWDRIQLRKSDAGLTPRLSTEALIEGPSQGDFHQSSDPNSSPGLAFSAAVLSGAPFCPHVQSVTIEHMKNEEDDLTLENVVPLQQERNPKSGRGEKNPKTKATPDVYQRILEKTLADEAAKQAASLTEEEEEFVRLLVSGDSYATAFKLCFPDRCVHHKTGKDLSITQLYDRGLSLSGTLRIRLKLKQLLEYQMLDNSHTAQRQLNLANRVLEQEATTAPKSGDRIRAAKELRAGAVVAKEADRQADELLTPEQVKAQIKAKLALVSG